ncbi:Six-hairpin glycosidase [Panus rudis PR-1116 ss-1]|nr:Six-hairpin glycosidase [Panus rudis PR-1116 ss-1]
MVTAQLSLPTGNATYMPPDASFGAQPSNKTVNSVDPHWPSLLGNLLWFYEAQRSGKLPENKRVPWRNDSAVEDGKDAGVDLSGGYYDAGDYVKFTYPLSFTLMSICWGAIDFGTGYDSANQTAYLDDMLRWGLDWLIKAHPLANTLFVQVGDSDLDNAYWGGDQGIPTPRASFQINETSPGTDAAAQASAAFSACSALYANHSLSSQSSPASLTNITYASTLLNHAQQLYGFATNTSQRTYQTSVPASADAYASSGYTDELTLAALFLALASNSSQLYAQGVSDYNQFNLNQYVKPGNDQVFNWDSKSPGVVVLGSQLAKMYPSLTSNTDGNSVNWTRDAEKYFDAMLDGNSRGFLTGGGLLWYSGDSDEASLNPSLNAAMLLTHYATSVLDTSSPKYASYLSFAQSQLNYTLGSNPMHVPYIVGTHPDSPRNPHSAIATGASPYDIANIDTVPEEERYVLYGAVVGGPDIRDRFWDLRSDWVQGEVALDYNAPLLSLVAYSIMNDTISKHEPVFVSIEPGSYDRVKPKGTPCDAAVSSGCGIHAFKSGGKIAMAVIVTVVGVVVLGLGSYWIYLVTRNSSPMLPKTG